jgi:hypothetical protein
VIRRLCWVAVGALLGVAGYRRAATLASACWPPGPVRALGRFAADVRDGMALYRERHPAGLGRHPRPAGPARGGLEGGIGRPAVPGAPHGRARAGQVRGGR